MLLLEITLQVNLRFLRIIIQVHLHLFLPLSVTLAFWSFTEGVHFYLSGVNLQEEMVQLFNLICSLRDQVRWNYIQAVQQSLFCFINEILKIANYVFIFS